MQSIEKNIYKSEEWLVEQYIILDKSTKQIAEEIGYSQGAVQKWLRQLGIKKKIKNREANFKKQKKYYMEYDFLYEQHIVQKKPVSKIAQEAGVSYGTICYHLKRNGIQKWNYVEQKTYTDEDVEKMKHMYVDLKMSANQIGKEFGTINTVIIRHLRKIGIKTRDFQESQFNYNKKEIPNELYDKELLCRLHLGENKSCKEISEMLGVDPDTVRRQMKKFGLKTKNNAESKIGLMIGSKHPNWRGGITELDKLLRGYFKVNIAPLAAQRDNYTCQLCGKTHTILHVHHIVPFREIVDTILSEHKELNIEDVDDKEKLYKIITTDERFLDQNNLITYCKECHLFKIHKYKKRQ